MPAVAELYKKYKGRDDFAFLTVSLDNTGSLDGLDDLIREHRIRYPVIWQESADGNGSPDSFDWGVNAVPTTFLINPDGVIVMDTWIDDDLTALLADLLVLDNPPPPAGLSTTERFNDDGSVTVVCDLYSPQHLPLEVSVSFQMMVLEYDDEVDPEHTGEPTKRAWISAADLGLDLGFTASFDMFGSAVHEFTVPDVAGAEYISYSVSAIAPGTEDLGNGGISISAGGFAQPPAEEE